MGKALTKIGRYDVLKLIKTYKTPCYIYDGEVIERRYLQLKNAFPDFDLFYSIKANPNTSICSFLGKLGSGAEITSAGELFLVLKAGFLPKNIIFNGPGKIEEELEYAIKKNIYLINVNSLEEIRRIEKIARKLNKKVKIGVRINPLPRESKQNYIITMGETDSRFGINEEEIPLLANLRLTNVKICGVHVYVGSQNLSLQSLKENFKKILTLSLKIVNLLKINLEMIDFGGGIGVPYKTGDKAVDLKNLGKYINNILGKQNNILKKTRYVLESGRFLVAESGIYLTKVIDVKISRGTKFVITDGGFNQQIRPALMKINHETFVIGRSENKNKEKVDVCGPCSTPEDILAKNIFLPPVKIGDIIAIKNSGAYGFTQSPLYFLSFKTPPEIMVYREKLYLIRKQGEYKDNLLKQNLYKNF